ncbi:MAG TPA: selenide, water dikinase SelD [bacterium]|nr:selenide, water dikinase SelD [bacterium]
MEKKFDLLTTVEYGGCSAKLPAKLLDTLLAGLPATRHEALIVGTETGDDAAVWKLDDETAIIHTVDFFPPICGDPYEFGRIAATNAISDIFAMGGRPLTALNLVSFPAARIDLAVLGEILRGGADAVAEAGAVVAGGHTIDDFPPKYGLAVTGIVHPDRVIRNCGARPGDALILTKPIGTGTLVAGHRIGEAAPEHYRAALDTMMQQNRRGAEIMQEFGVRCATDITGFGLLGHALKMAKGSGVVIDIDASAVPLLDGAYRLTEMGCIPGAAFNNLKHVADATLFAEGLDYNLKMLLCDPQTSGGLLICCEQGIAGDLLAGFREAGYRHATCIGAVRSGERAKDIFVRVKP